MLEDNEIRYSATIALRMQQAKLEVYNCYPNPVQDELFVDFGNSAVEEGELEMIIYNMLGQPVLFESKVVAKGRQLNSISTLNLTEGAYVLELRLNNQFSWRRQFVKY
jgi:hypothetical protein